jgi:ribosomal protein S18 acetylase RimI-like enzyme
MRNTWRPRSVALSEVTRLAIRAAAAADAPAISHVHRESWRTTYAGILPLAVIAEEAGRKSAEIWRRRLAPAAPESAIWVAESDGEVVGFASCGRARHRLQGLEAEVYALYVLQDSQRRGAGRALLGACARHFVRHGQFGFYLWVLKANRARLFYESQGAEEIAARSERLGQHAFAEIAYAWNDLGPLVASAA